MIRIGESCKIRPVANVYHERKLGPFRFQVDFERCVISIYMDIYHYISTKHLLGTEDRDK